MNPKDSEFYIPLDELRKEADNHFTYVLGLLCHGKDVVGVPEQTTRDMTRITGDLPVTEVSDSQILPGF